MRTSVAVALILALAGCREATEIVVVVHTDLVASGAIDRLVVKVKSPSMQVAKGNEWDLTKIPPPVRYALYPGSTPEGETVDITAVGQLKDKAVVSRDAHVKFVPGKIRMVRIALLRSCGAICPALGGDSLEPWDESKANQPPDGGSPREQGIADARIDGPRRDLSLRDGPGTDGRPDNGAPDQKRDGKRDGVKPPDVSLDKPPKPPDAPPKPDAPWQCNQKPTTSACTGPDVNGMTWCTIPAGCFTMGAPSTEPCSGCVWGGDWPTHKVTLTHAFQISETEVTIAQYKKVMGTYPAAFPTGYQPPAWWCPTGENCPVTLITWQEAAKFCNALSGNPQNYCFDPSNSWKPSSKFWYYECPGFRLPTEAEWEYAARAGWTDGTYVGAVGLNCANDSKLNQVAWYLDDRPGKWLQPVKGKTPNKWGLHDMLGNAWELTADGGTSFSSADATNPLFLQASSYVTKGGSVEDGVKCVRLAARAVPTGASLTQWMFGFRCVRTTTP